MYHGLIERLKLMYGVPVRLVRQITDFSRRRMWGAWVIWICIFVLLALIILFIAVPSLATPILGFLGTLASATVSLLGVLVTAIARLLGTLVTAIAGLLGALLNAIATSLAPLLPILIPYILPFMIAIASLVALGYLLFVLLDGRLGTWRDRISWSAFLLITLIIFLASVSVTPAILPFIGVVVALAIGYGFLRLIMEVGPPPWPLSRWTVLSALLLTAIGIFLISISHIPGITGLLNAIASLAAPLGRRLILVIPLIGVITSLGAIAGLAFLLFTRWRSWGKWDTHDERYNHDERYKRVICIVCIFIAVFFLMISIPGLVNSTVSLIGGVLTAIVAFIGAVFTRALNAYTAWVSQKSEAAGEEAAQTEEEAEERARWEREEVEARAPWEREEAEERARWEREEAHERARREWERARWEREVEAEERERARRAEEREQKSIQERVLHNCIAEISELLSKGNSGEPDNDDQKIAAVKAKILAALLRLDKRAKGILLQFLYDTNLVKTGQVAGSNHALHIIQLSGADLSETELPMGNLSRADLSGADLSGANLAGTNLSEADLSRVNLTGTRLAEAILRGTNLWGASGVTKERLEQQANRLAGAIMPDGTIYPGRYATRRFKPAASLEVDEDWHLTRQETTAGVFLETETKGGNLIFIITNPRHVFDPSNLSEQKVVPAPQSIDEWVSWFQRHPHLEASNPAPVSVGGASGMRIDLTAASTPENYPMKFCGEEPCVPLYPLSDDSAIISSEGLKDRFVIVNVGGQTVLINVAAPEDMFEEFLPKAQKVLDTVEWENPMNLAFLYQT